MVSAFRETGITENTAGILDLIAHDGTMIAGGERDTPWLNLYRARSLDSPWLPPETAEP